MYRQAIVTTFYGPTTHRGARIRALAQAGSVTVQYDHALNGQDNHKRAAKALAEKLNWHGFWVMGGLPNGTSDVFVIVADYAPAEQINDIEIAFAVAPRG